MFRVVHLDWLGRWAVYGPTGYAAGPFDTEAKAEQVAASLNAY